MFWKYDEEKDEVVPREKEPLTPSEFAEKAREAGHNWPVDDEEHEQVFKELSGNDDGFGSSNEDGSEDRFKKRIATFMQEEKPVYKHHVWWLIHNCVAHPLIGIAPCKATFDFHDWTSTKINGK